MIPPFMEEIWFRAFFGGLIGLVFGSFITMLSYRLPRGLSIVSPPSHCPVCNARLTPLDLIPVLSWVLMRGECRHCGTSISIRYPLIELTTCFLTVLASVFWGISLEFAVAVVGIVFFMTSLTRFIEK